MRLVVVQLNLMLGHKQKRDQRVFTFLEVRGKQKTKVSNAVLVSGSAAACKSSPAVQRHAELKPADSAATPPPSRLPRPHAPCTHHILTTSCIQRVARANDV